MDLEKAQGLAIYLMYDHGLPIEWKFRWHNKKRSLGSCSYIKKRIYLAKWYTKLNDVSEVKDTILHEIAHALSYERYGSKGTGHGRLWKSICREIGAIPKACTTTKLNHPNNHYKYMDICCGVTYKRHRLRKNVSYSCPKCRLALFVSKEDKIASRATLDLIDEIFSE